MGDYAMATFTDYRLDFQPGSGPRDLVAQYSLNFSLFSEFLFYNRGSYNRIDDTAGTLYVNNKQNGNLVSVSCNLGQYSRDIPPYGEAWLPVRGYDIVTLACNGGSAACEFINSDTTERIFQRTDSGAQIVQFSGALGVSFADLVTVDAIGRIQPANAQPFASNNTTTGMGASTAWPAAPAGFTFTAARCWAAMDRRGYLVGVDGNGAAAPILWVSNNAGVSQNTAIGAGPQVTAHPCVVTENDNFYYLFSPDFARPQRYAKSNLAMTPGPAIGLLTAVVIPKGGSAGDGDYWTIHTTGGNAIIKDIVNDAVVNTSGAKSTTGIQFATNRARSVAMLANGFLVLARCDATTIDVSILDPSDMSAGTPTFAAELYAANPTKQFNNLDPIFNTQGYGVIPFLRNAGSTMAAFIVTPSGGVSSLNMALAATICAARVCADDGFIVGSSGGANITLKKLGPTGALVSTALFTPPACTGFIDLMPIPINDLGDTAFAVIYNDAGVLKCFIVDENLLALTATASPFTIAGNVASWGVYSATADFATVSAGTQPITVRKDFAKSVFGVSRDGGAVLVQGYAQINQVFPGSNTFNQNAATVVGNRGLVVNSTVQLNGLT